jgi:hypothetical protein
MQDGFCHACANEMNLVFAFLPATPGFAYFAQNVSFHFCVHYGAVSCIFTVNQKM